MRALKEYVKFLSLEEKDLDYLQNKRPLFVKYWFSNTFYLDINDKTKIVLTNSKEKFDFSKFGIALKLIVYPDTIILSNLSGIFLKPRSIVLGKVVKVNKKRRIACFKGVNFIFIANNFSKKQLE